VARLVLVDPDTERHLEPKLLGDGRYQLTASGAAVGAYRLRVRAEHLEIGANLRLGRAIAEIGMLRAGVRRIGDAGEGIINTGDRLVPLEQTPQAGMHAQNEHHHSRNGAHGRLTSPEEKRGPNPSPTVNRSQRKIPQLKINLQVPRVMASDGRFKERNN